jgi:YggT family protein|tara:strand:- start:2690 stop:2977 length:288 start_codon:yes stop_codon:yes gene_type:complete
MNSIFLLIDAILDLYSWVIIITVVLSWLSSLNIINNSNQVVRMFHEASWRLTEPVLSRIRSFLPSLGSIDISPIIALLAIYFLRSLLREYWPLAL